MMRAFSIFKRPVLVRLSLCLLVVACSQSAFETYGCACASRSYTVAEIEGYRAGAARGDLKSLAEMEEYHGWRSEEFAPETQKYEQEKKLAFGYRQRLLAANDPETVEQEIFDLIYGAGSVAANAAERHAILLKAKAYHERLGLPLTMYDGRGSDRTQITVAAYLQRELARTGTGPIDS